MEVKTSPRIWIVAAVLLAVILVCLVGVFAWREHSYTEFSMPTELPNLSNVTRRIVQPGGNNQYFLLHVCMALLDCNGCQCGQEQSLFTAVVVKFGITEPEEIDDVEIDFFLLNGCCRCINT